MKMPFPLSIMDFTLWLAITAIVLNLTSEFTSPEYGKIHLIIKRERMEKITRIFKVLFIIAFGIYIITMLTT